MRTIKFRGKRVDNGEWIYGDLIHRDVLNDVCIANRNKTRCVLPETVGQFTGLTDKNEVEIYEGDIIKICVSDAFHSGNNLHTSFECVEFNNGCFGVIYGIHRDFIRLDGFHKTTFEVSSNIHDNPELLKGDQS